MLGYVHLLPETRPALERRTVAGTALWVLEGDLDGGLLPRRRLRRWTRRLAECGVSHAALPPGREAEFAPIPAGCCRTDCGWRCCRGCWTAWPRQGHGPAAGGPGRQPGRCAPPGCWRNGSGTYGFPWGRGRRPWSGSCCGSWG